MKNKLFINLVIFLLIMAVTACATPQLPEPTSIPEAPVAPTVATEASTRENTATAVPSDNTQNSAPEETAVVEPDLATDGTIATEQVAYNGVSFDYPSALAGEVIAETVDAPTQPQPGPGWNNPPTYDIFNFQDYVLDEQFPSPNIAVYPVREAASRSPEAKRQIETLQALLSTRPAADQVTALPYLPVVNAAMVFHSQFAYVPFTNGDGVRYVTMFGQSINSVTNQGLFYTFQGLTNDGEYFVSASFPVRTDALPDEVASDFDYDALVANYEPYIADIKNSLDALGNSDFTPDLAIFDATMHTVAVEREPQPPRTDAAGNLLLTISYPVAGGVIQIGEALQINGYTAVDNTTPIEVALITGSNTLITGTVLANPVDGQWTTTLTVPPNVSGRGQVTATQDASADAVSIHINSSSTPQPESEAATISIWRPNQGSTAAAGYPVYFEGTVTNPIDNQVTIGVLIDECTTWNAQQAFSVAGSAQWRGVIILPQIVTDEFACAVAFTGTYGEGDWREVQVPLPIVAADDSRAMRLQLETSTLEFQAGATARIGGTAVTAEEVEVIITNQETGDVLAAGIAPVGVYGLWEIELPIPEDAPDFVGVKITIVEDPPSEEPYIMTTGATVTR